jgi:capsular exopolysaccharide synthesis family protein
VTTQEREEQAGPVVLLRTFRRQILIIIACAVLVPGAALAFSLLQQKQYSATASLLFRDPQFDQKLFGSAVFTPQDPNREAATNVKLVSLGVVGDRTAKALKGLRDAGQITTEVVVTSAGQSNVANITATDPDPVVAAKLANTFAEQYIAFRRDADRSKIAAAQRLVQQQLTGLPKAEQDRPQGTALRQRAEQLQILAALQTGNAELVQPASVPGAASSPRPLRNTAIGLMLGILIGLGLAVLRERFDRRLKDPKEISESFDRPLLGAIPESRNIARAHQGTLELGAGEAEAFRMLRANLRYFNVDRRVISVLITSASAGEGKSTVAVHLAAAAASSGAKVLLLESDLRRPTLAKRLGVSQSAGLSHVLSGDLTIHDAAQAVPVSASRRVEGLRTMDVVVAGPIPPNPADLLESERMREIIRRAESEYDLVIVDTPPTSVVSDAVPLVKEVSGVIVVTRLGQTTRESAATLRNQLENLNAHTLGVVVNAIGRTGRYGYGGYGGYGYGYEPAAEPPTQSSRPSTPARSTNGNGQAETNGHSPAQPATRGSELPRADVDAPTGPSREAPDERPSAATREVTFDEDYLEEDPDERPSFGKRILRRRD